ncbi:hypothetical protein SAY86_028405 [Trapa natans]|uniref:Uncharacterized protein n=1 Tax=Trapa natans TaxID=22666 RepID=A0AAN7M262_TRANT|nr:hypothetical protein SAY86_028405 [Trapa natans]
MWRRLTSSQLKAFAFGAVSAASRRSASSSANRFITGRPLASATPVAATLLAHRGFSSESATTVKKVEDVMPIATGHEREELEAELEGRDLLDINYPVGPFGTKRMSMMSSGFGWRRESPMNVQSALSILFLKSWVLEDHPMGMGTMGVITDSALRVSFRNKNYGDDERVSVCTLLSKTCTNLLHPSLDTSLIGLYPFLSQLLVAASSANQCGPNLPLYFLHRSWLVVMPCFLLSRVTEVNIVSFCTS